MEVTAEGEKESLEGLSASGGKFIRGGKHGGGRWSENVSSSTQARSESRGHSPGGRFRDNSMELKKEIETALSRIACGMIERAQ